MLGFGRFDVAQIFTTPDAWLGGFYEAALEFEHRDEERVVAALTALWSHPGLLGCFLDRTREPAQQARIPFASSLLEHGHLYGVAHLSDERSVAAGTIVTREDDGSDWVKLYLPMGSLGRIFPVEGFPFDDRDHEAWRVEVENWLADVAVDIYREVPFDLALIGFETRGEHHAAEVREQGIPPTRLASLLVPNKGHLTRMERTER